MKRLSTLLFLFIATVSGVCAQDSLVLSRHLPRLDDVLRCQPLADRPLLKAGGKGVCWSLEETVHDGKAFKRSLTGTADSSLIAQTEHDTRYYYGLRADTLLVRGFENNASKVDLVYPVGLIRFPMRYGDALSGVYGGKGICFDRQRLSAVGRYMTRLDGEGTLVLPDGDTLRHVLRVRCMQKERDIARDIHTDGRRLGVDTIVVVKETLLWYAVGYRYPVLERVCTDVLSGKPARYVSLYYISPEEQRALEDDEENEQLRTQLAEEDGRGGADGGGIQSGSLTYRFSQHNDGQYVTIAYDLQEGGTVEFVLCDTHGITYRSLSRTETAGEGYSINISYAGLTRGQYVLYIRMNGEQYSEKFNVR